LPDFTFIQSNQPTVRPIVNKKTTAGQGGGKKGKKIGGVQGKKTTAENAA